MKENYFKKISTFLIVTFLIASCKKETKEINYDFGFHREECRQVSNNSEFGNYTYTYYQRGMVDQWNIDFLDGYFTMEYNAIGQLVKSKFYSEGVLTNTIVFFYQGNRVVKETWYDGDTQTKVDEIFYTFNRHGKVTKGQSFLDDYTSIYKYTPDGGSVSEWDFYLGGILNYSQQFTYLPPHHKEPDLARPGLDYDFFSASGRESQSNWYSTSEKDISYDENGMNPQVLLDQDPHKSVITFNRRNYVTGTDFFDNLTQSYVHFRFAYENCGSDDGDNATFSSKSQEVNNTKMTLGKFLRIGSPKSIKEQVNEFRNQYLNNL
jgi:hypothetical protein